MHHDGGGDSRRVAPLQQVVLHHFLPSGSARRMLRMSQLREMDFGVACFCCNKKRHSGYVCSVCLFVFCSAEKACTYEDVGEGKERCVCSVCGTPIKEKVDGAQGKPIAARRRSGTGGAQRKRPRPPAE